MPQLWNSSADHGTPVLGLEMADKEQNRLVHAAAILKKWSHLESFDNSYYKLKPHWKDMNRLVES